jgi:Glycine cleavage H-protein
MGRGPSISAIDNDSHMAAALVMFWLPPELHGGKNRANPGPGWAPKVGDEVTKDQPYAEIESVKTVSDLIAPLPGRSSG